MPTGKEKSNKNTEQNLSSRTFDTSDTKIPGTSVLSIKLMSIHFTTVSSSETLVSLSCKERNMNLLIRETM